MSEGLASTDSKSTIGILEYISKPWSSMKDVPKSVRGRWAITHTSQHLEQVLRCGKNHLLRTQLDMLGIDSNKLIRKLMVNGRRS